MGFYLRKSIKVGPVRFNLSKSGIGTSLGVRGFRVGSGPRGNYVHMGRHGLYYRQTLPGGSPASPRIDHPSPLVHAPAVPDTLQEIESADVGQMCDSSSADLLAELNEKQRRLRHAPFAIVGSAIALIFLLASETNGLVLLVALVLAVAGTIFLSRRDELRKSVVLFYDFDETMDQRYELFHQWAAALAGCGGVWHVSASGAVGDRRYHAGASNLVRRNATTIRKAAPPYVKTNIEIVAIAAGRQTLYFFPDRLLVYEGNRVGAISYPDLTVRPANGRFIEDGSVPRDATIVDYTWQYVNKSGTPDKRFKNNRQLPVCLYGELHFTSSTGLNELIQISRHELADGFAGAIKAFAGESESHRSIADAANAS